MSIISEALKKAKNSQIEKLQIAVTSEAEKTSESIKIPPIQKQVSLKTHNTVIISVVCFCIFLIITLGIFLSLKIVINKNKSVSNTTVITPQVEEKNTEPVPLKITPPPEKIIPEKNNPPVISEEKLGFKDLKLNGIMSSTSGPLAVINGNIVHEGEKFDGFTVIKINDNNVLLEKNSFQKTISLKE